MIPSGDTWGISGPTFLLAYLVLALAVAAAASVARRALADVSAERPASRMEQRPYDVAYLNGDGSSLSRCAQRDVPGRDDQDRGRGFVVAAERPDSRTDELGARDPPRRGDRPGVAARPARGRERSHRRCTASSSG